MPINMMTAGKILGVLFSRGEFFGDHVVVGSRGTSVDGQKCYQPVQIGGLWIQLNQGLVINTGFVIHPRW